MKFKFNRESSVLFVKSGNPMLDHSSLSYFICIRKTNPVLLFLTISNTLLLTLCPSVIPKQTLAHSSLQCSQNKIKEVKIEKKQHINLPLCLKLEENFFSFTF